MAKSRVQVRLGLFFLLLSSLVLLGWRGGDSAGGPPHFRVCFVVLWSGGRWGCGRGQEPPRNHPPPPNPAGDPPKTLPNTPRSASSDSAHRPLATPTFTPMSPPTLWPRPPPLTHCAGAAPDWWRQLLGAQAPPIPLWSRPPRVAPPPSLFIAPLGPPLINATNERSEPVTSDPAPQ